MFHFKNYEELKMFVNEQIIETKEVAQILGCSRQYVDQLIKENKIVPIKVLNKNRLFYKPDVLKLKKS